MVFFTLLFLLLAGHAVADFGLQSAWMTANKVPGSLVGWQHVLAAHALMQGLTVYLATHGSLSLGLAETVIHFGVDYGKGKGWYGFNVDQAIHVACRVLWAALVLR